MEIICDEIMESKDNFSNPWTQEVDRLRALEAAVLSLIHGAERVLENTRCDYPDTLMTLMAGIKLALGDGKPVTVYTKTFKDGCSGLEEVQDGPILD